MKFKVGFVIEEDHLGKALAALHRFNVEMIGIDVMRPAVQQIADKGAAKRPMKDVTPASGKKVNLVHRLLDAMRQGPITSRDALAMARHVGKSEQAAYGALNALQKRGKVVRGADKYYRAVETEVHAHG